MRLGVKKPARRKFWPRHTAGEAISQKKGQQVDEDNGEKDIFDCQPQRGPERLVLKQCDIVFKPYKIFSAGNAVPVCKSKVYAVKDGNDNDQGENKQAWAGKAQKGLRLFKKGRTAFHTSVSFQSGETTRILVVSPLLFLQMWRAVLACTARGRAQGESGCCA